MKTHSEPLYCASDMRLDLSDDHRTGSHRTKNQSTVKEPLGANGIFKWLVNQVAIRGTSNDAVLSNDAGCRDCQMPPKKLLCVTVGWLTLGL